MIDLPFTLYLVLLALLLALALTTDFRRRARTAHQRRASDARAAIDETPAS